MTDISGVSSSSGSGMVEQPGTADSKRGPAPKEAAPPTREEVNAKFYEDLENLTITLDDGTEYNGLDLWNKNWMDYVNSNMKKQGKKQQDAMKKLRTGD